MFTILIMSVLFSNHTWGEGVEKWRKTYDELMVKNQQQLEEEQVALEKKYVVVLEQKSKTFQEQGQLEAVLHLRDLMEAINEAEGPGSPLEAQQDPYISDIRTSYYRAWEKLYESASKREQNLRNTYLERLEAEIVRKTQSGEIETALEFRKEMEAVKAMGMVPNAMEEEEEGKEGEAVQYPMVEFEGSRYFYIQKVLSWQEAREQAKRMGGHLWIMNSKAEWAAVRRISGMQRAWIGAYEVEPGKRMWLDGTPLQKVKGIRFRFSSSQGSEPAITIGGRGTISDRSEEASRGKVQGFIVETPKYSAGPYSALAE